MNTSIFTLNDRVTSKNIGLPFVGTLYGIIDAKTFIMDMILGQRYRADAYFKWDEFCPDWKNENVCYVKYDSPQRPIAFSEYVESYAKYYNIEIDEKMHDWLQNKYKEVVLEKMCCVHPEADLELFE